MVTANTDRYRLIITDNPATTIMIGWDQTNGNTPVVYYDTVDHGINVGSYAFSKAVDRTSSYRGMTNTFAKLSGLAPNTNYYFVIQDSNSTSQRFWFRTAPNTNEAMTFISGGDSRNNRTPRQNANLMVSKLKPTAVFFGGDMTDDDTDTQWFDWFDDWQYTIASDGRMFPIIPARGNHEDSNAVIYNLFNVPSTSAYYEITFGANLYTIYTLNSEITEGGTQANWLQTSLQSNTSIWKSAQYHKPMRPHEPNKSEGNNEYNAWAQLFFDFGVDLVYESDSHVVKTTWPVQPCTGGAGCDEGFVRNDAQGTVYVGEGCWGAPLRTASDTKVWTRNNGSFNQFKYVCVYPTGIELQTINVNNAASVDENPNVSVCNLPLNTTTWGDTVIIGAPLNKPVVTITNPTDGQHFTNGANILIEASATDADGTIVSMEFFIDGVSIGADTTAPFSISQSIADGTHSITALATDNDGQLGSDTINITIGAFSDTIDVTIGSAVEEGEGDGNIYTGSSDLEMVYDSFDAQGYQTIGLQFTSINVPQGAEITNAYIQFEADESHSDPAELLIYIDKSDNALNFNTTAFNVSDRISCGNESVYWAPNAWTAGENGPDTRTPDLSTLIQAVISRDGWSSGNNMTFMIQGTGVSLSNVDAKRVAESNIGVLHVEYTLGGSGVGLRPKAYLQGPLTTSGNSLMDDSLRTGGLIPTTSPYPDAVTAPLCVFDVTGDDAIVDWVWIELRDSSDNTNIIASRSALIQRDGDVVHIDGVSNVWFNVSEGSYYIAVNHRNHLGIMTATPVTISRAVTTIDFSSDAATVLGGSNAFSTLNGVNAMISGDFDGNGQVQTADVNQVTVLLGGAGYENADLDMNGQIQTPDINVTNYPNIGKGQQF
ncbi:MAG: fibronectin type III domain-containing protein [Flavobacteriaceae bacterium]|nr:fibronectin type III domain-containing protein [Flavobacteriaceae bacterium]